ncbi:MAG: hypothetical protein QGI46_02740 [Planctomycetota bacterium]|nr:hypothetical protein [Planctomycetota bacterium]
MRSIVPALLLAAVTLLCADCGGGTGVDGGPDVDAGKTVPQVREQAKAADEE